MKPIDVKNNKRVYIDEHNEKDSKFKVDDRVRISRYKDIFAKGYAPNWSSEIFIVNKINDTVPYTYNNLKHEIDFIMKHDEFLA